MLPLISNFSPFAVGISAQQDAQARQFYIVIISAAFGIRSDGVTEPLIPQPDPIPIDVFHGDPAQSSLRYPDDFALRKSFTDIIVNGAAHAPRGRPVREMVVSLRIGGKLEKRLLVTGDRNAMASGALSDAEPFVEMPLVYERAYGGTVNDAMLPENPVGIGYRGALSADPTVRSASPNIAYLDDDPAFGSRNTPAGFGAVARNWSPRIGYAGTYDEAWQQTQFPLVPLDFDVRFHQTAPADQQLADLQGNEAVEIRNMTRDGIWTFQLPGHDVPLALRYANRATEAACKLDTVIIEPEMRRVTIKTRATISAPPRGPPLHEVVVGHATRGWWTARLSGKHYVGSRRGSGGRRETEG